MIERERIERERIERERIEREISEREISEREREIDMERDRHFFGNYSEYSGRRGRLGRG